MTAKQVSKHCGGELEPQTIPVTFYRNDDGEVQAVELEIDGVLHCTADIREKGGNLYQVNPAVLLVCSRATMADTPVSLRRCMRELVDIGGATAVTVDAIVQAKNEPGDVYEWYRVEHPVIKDLFFSDAER